MTKQKPPYRYTKTMTMTEPKKETCLPIAFSEWNKLKKMVARIRDYSILLQSLGSLLIGCASAAFIGALTLCNKEVVRERNICWTIFLVTLSTGILTLIYAKKERNDRKVSAQDIIEEMRFIEKHYKI